MIQRILISLSILTFLSELKADCLACWETQFIQIELENGDTRSGFILWNRNWLLDSNGNYEGLTSFCDTIVKYYGNRRLKIYENIRVFNHILPDVPIAIDGFDIIYLEKVINLDKSNHKHNFLPGATYIPIITKLEEKQLSTKPLFIYQTYGDELSDAYYVNYNPKIEKSEIERLVRDGTIKKYKNVIKIEVHYD